ncbi:LacI family transcriptional regulator [Rossellomorea vietnamensis]|uniref:LacI family transcriptional regulator n=2 Tax=Rossellomorea TaxID=2837508 RepID=A0A5D4KAX4_9BACI|nr:MULTISPECIES: LacI family DNA-binding transcriptional regulator [Rossellomorea]TYR74534.1 LacI family transcriptional regulator [Rossellomorea vietnamensis]TYS75096.1 LacI family transcriptional regulator [Rossellomorea aquimaris]
MNLTIRDIAKMAGVSPATVSKIMNNYGGISEATRQKVYKIIEETKYQPTFSAKSLATKKSNLIGLVYAGKINVDFTHPFFNEVINSFKKAVGTLGYDILLFSNEKIYQGESKYLERCRHFHVDGCLIIAGDEIEEEVEEITKSDIPCIGIDLKLDGPRSSYIMTDNTKIGLKVVEHLYLNQTRKVGYIGGKTDSLIASIRNGGFMEGMAQFGLPIREEWIRYGDFFEESGYRSMKEILQAEELPEAVFAASDMMALGALKAIKEEGLSVPNDIQLIGCDDIESCRYTDPPLTTVKQDKQKLGKLAAYMLNDLIQDNQDIQPVKVDPELVIRSSSIERA